MIYRVGEKECDQKKRRPATCLNRVEYITARRKESDRGRERRRSECEDWLCPFIVGTANSDWSETEIDRTNPVEGGVALLTPCPPSPLPSPEPAPPTPHGTQSVTRSPSSRIPEKHLSKGPPPLLLKA